MKKNLDYNASCNLILAYCTLCELRQMAAEKKVPIVSQINSNFGGVFTFFIDNFEEKPGFARIENFETMDKDVFAERIREFKQYWMGVMNPSKEERIAKLKAELESLESLD